VMPETMFLQPVLIVTGLAIAGLPLLPPMRRRYAMLDPSRGRVRELRPQARAILRVPHPSVVVAADGGRGTGTRAAALRHAYAMSWIIAALMVAVSFVGLFVHGLYKDGAWAREALRGGDLVTLVVAVPLLIAALVLARRGSRRAEVVWIGMLAYSVYDYAYYVFGSKFNDAFLLHISLFSLSVFSLALALPNLDVRAIGTRLLVDRTARWIGGFLVAVGVLQGLLWAFVLVRYVVNGQLIKEIPVGGQHLVFALDLGLLVPSLVVAGVLLWRRTPDGAPHRRRDGRDGCRVSDEPDDRRRLPGGRARGWDQGIPP
jgi:hypothetical protein